MQIRYGWIGVVAAVVGASSASAQNPATAAAPKYYTSPDSVMKTLPFSEAVQVGSLLFLSGQIGVLPGTTTLAPGGIGPESRQALENIRAVLGRHGASLKDVVKCTVFLADMGEWAAFNVVFRADQVAPSSVLRYTPSVL